MQLTHYKILGVSSTASDKEIWRAYDVARVSLPNGWLERLLVYLETGVSNGTLTEALSVLSDPVKRAKYDNWVADLSDYWCWLPPG